MSKQRLLDGDLVKTVTNSTSVEQEESGEPAALSGIELGKMSRRQEETPLLARLFSDRPLSSVETETETEVEAAKLKPQLSAQRIQATLLAQSKKFQAQVHLHINNAPISKLASTRLERITKCQEDDDKDDDPLLEVMDLIEDEVDYHAYDDLVPLQVKLALEETVFGWSHLLSDIFGHIAFTVGYYMVAYVIVSEICWKRDNEGDYKLIWNMSESFFRWSSRIICTIAGFNGFCTVRRRRQVWLRVVYGTNEYAKDEQRRRQSVENTDRTTLLGKIRRRRERWASKRVQRKLKRAENRFDKRMKRPKSNRQSHQKMVQGPESGSNYFALSPIKKIRHKDNDNSCDDNASSPLDALSPRTRSTSRRFRTDPHMHQQDAISLKNHPNVRSHTGPTNSIQSVGHDQVLFSTGMIQNAFYAHGGFFGAAPFMLANPYWIDILRYLMPDVYVAISPRVHRPASELIHWAENNPVVAAFGTAHELEFSGKVPNIEWDVFLDPHLVQRVELVLEEREKFLKSYDEERNLFHGKDDATTASTSTSTSTARSNTAATAATMSESERAILGYYDAEVSRRTQLLLDRMLIAHGNSTQLIMEQTGYLKKYNFSRVKRTCRTLGGGIPARQWLALYAEALQMGMCDDEYDDEHDYIDDGNDADELEHPGSLESSSPASPVSSEDEGDFGIDTVGGVIQLSGCSSAEFDRNRDSEESNITSFSDPTLQQTSAVEALSDDGHLSFDEGLINYSHSDAVKTNENDVSQPRMDINDILIQQEECANRTRTTSLDALTASQCPDASISESIAMLKSIVQSNAPLGLFLDVKSRHVPKRVWGLIVDALRDAGARVEGIGSFMAADVRGISYYSSNPVKEGLFFHSAGDMQRACHEGRVQQGDVVFFNGGSLFWEKPDYTVSDCILGVAQKRCSFKFDASTVKRNYKFLPYARVEKGIIGNYNSNAQAQSGTITSMRSIGMEREANGTKQYVDTPGMFLTSSTETSTIQQYKEKFNLSIGLYVQEFSIDEAAISMLTQLVNDNPDVYKLGLNWGGVNGATVGDIQPGRFTNTDGYWNQRYLGEKWNAALSASSCRRP